MESNSKTVMLVALLAGGYSAEGGVAVWSAQHIEQVFEGDEEYRTYLIRVHKDGWYYEDPKNEGQRVHIDRRDFSLTLANEEKIKFDFAVLLMGGSPGEDGQMQGYLQLTNVPFVGCGLLPSAVTFDKSIANRLVRSFNSSVVHVSPSIDFFRGTANDASAVLSALDNGQLRLPLIVKPADSGSSLGVSKVSDVSQLNEALNTAFNESSHVLVEQFIEGREITVGVARLNGRIRVLPITEIIHPPSTTFFDEQTKFKGSPDIQIITPADLSEETQQRAETGATELYEKFNLSGVVRIDMMLESPNEKLFFLEVNSSPGQTSVSVITKQLAVAGWAGSKLVEFYKQLFKEVL